MPDYFSLLNKANQNTEQLRSGSSGSSSGSGTDYFTLLSTGKKSAPAPAPTNSPNLLDQAGNLVNKGVSFVSDFLKSRQPAPAPAPSVDPFMAPLGVGSVNPSIPSQSTATPLQDKVMTETTRFGARTLVSFADLVTESLDFVTDYTANNLINKDLPQPKFIADANDHWLKYYGEQEVAGNIPTQKLKKFVDNLQNSNFIKSSPDWEKSSTKEKLTTKLGETILNLSPSVLSSAAAFIINPVFGFAVSAASTANDIKDLGVEYGLPRDKAEKLGLSAGLLIGAIDKIVPDEVLTGDVKKKFVGGFTKRLVKISLTAGKEAGTEMVQEDIQLLAEKTFREDLGWDEVKTRNAMAGLGGLFGGVGFGLVGNFSDTTVRKEILGREDVDAGADITKEKPKTEPVEAPVKKKVNYISSKVYAESLDNAKSGGSVDIVNITVPERLDGEVDPNQINIVKSQIENGDKLNPIVINQEGVLLDGFHRLTALKELGIEKANVVVQQTKSEAKIEPVEETVTEKRQQKKTEKIKEQKVSKTKPVVVYDTKIDPIKYAESLGFDKIQESFGSKKETREFVRDVWAKNGEDGVYYHVGQSDFKKFEKKKAKNYDPKLRGRGISMINGLYVGRDSAALNQFYGTVVKEDTGTDPVISKYYGNPKWLDLSNLKDEKAFLRDVKKKYKIKDTSSAKFGDALEAEVLARGYDGVKYFDPYATGEEFVLINQESVSKKSKKKRPLSQIKEEKQDITNEIDFKNSESKGKAENAQYQRDGINTGDVANLKKVYFRSQRFQDGDIETIRNSKSGKLVDRVIENVQEKFPGMTEQEAFDYALSLPTKADETPKRLPEVKDLKDKLKQIDSEYAEYLKKNGLAVGVRRKAIKNGLKMSFGSLPEYEAVDIDTQSEEALKLLVADKTYALDIALGKVDPPPGLLPEAVFIAVENDALERGDTEVIRQLATESQLVSDATAMGQRIRMLAERNPYSPTSAINKVVKFRQSKAEEKSGKKISQLKKEAVAEMKKEIEKAAPKKSEWGLFIDSIKCKV